MRNPYLTKELIKIAGIPEYQAKIMSAEAHKFYIEDKPLAEIISKVGGTAAAAQDNLNNLKRVNTVRGDNSPRSKGPGNKGVAIDKQFPISGYESYSQCVEGLVNDLSLDRTSAENECATHFGGAETSSDAGKKTAAAKRNHLLQTVKTSNTINVHNANRRDVLMDSIKIGQDARANDIEPEEVPAWAYTISNNYQPPNPRRSNSSNTKSARQIGDDMLYQYMQLRTITHPDSLNAVPVIPEFEEMLHKKSELLATKAEINRLKNAKREPVDPRPAWLICMDR